MHHYGKVTHLKDRTFCDRRATAGKILLSILPLEKLPMFSDGGAAISITKCSVMHFSAPGEQVGPK